VLQRDQVVAFDGVRLRSAAGDGAGGLYVGASNSGPATIGMTTLEPLGDEDGLVVHVAHDGSARLVARFASVGGSAFVGGVRRERDGDVVVTAGWNPDTDQPLRVDVGAMSTDLPTAGGGDVAWVTMRPMP
jgi:hypothetical protein